MDHEIRKIAVYSAVLVLFVLAAVSWLYGCGQGVCASRALLGAIVIYVMVSLAGRLVMRIIIGAMVESRLEKQRKQTARED